MTGNMHFCTKSKKDFPHVTLVFEDGKWVEAHKMILAASSCLCLAENSKKTSASTDLYEKNSEQYPIQWVLSIFEGL